MTSDGYRKPPEADLAALLHGLRYRGLAVGPDDAAKIVAVFRHADNWSHQRRVRVLKNLLARTEEERRLIDQLAPFLFVNVTQYAEEEAPSVSSSAGVEREDPSQPLYHPGAGTRQRATEDEESDNSRQRWWNHWLKTGRFWLAIGVFVPTFAITGWVVFTVQFSVNTPQEYKTPSAPPTLPDERQPRLPPEGVPAESSLSFPPLDLSEPPPPPLWPFWMLLGVSCLPVLSYVFRSARFHRQSLNLRTLAASEGPKTYRLDVPLEQIVTSLDPNLVRDAAFHMSAASAQVSADWLDVHQTVESTARNAGQLTLCFDTWLEHKPVVFIEDIAPSMVRWPNFGRQLVGALARQGEAVVHYYMDRAPDLLSEQWNRPASIPLEQVLTNLSDPTVVVLSDAASLNAHGTTAKSPWVGTLARATWLHPQGPEMWGVGAKWLIERVKVVPLNDEGLQTLSIARGSDGEGVPRRWRPPLILGQSEETRLAALRAILGEAAFFWLAAGAVLDRVGTLSTRLWWALRDEAMPEVPKGCIDRVWELTEVQVGGDGTVKLSSELRDTLIRVLTKEQPHLLSTVVAWAEKYIKSDLQQLDPQSLAAVEAQALLGRLQLIDPQRRFAARRSLKRLAREGFGAWVEVSEAEEPFIRRLRLSLARTKQPGKWALTALAGGIIGIATAIGLLQKPELVFPPKADFQFLAASPLIITPEQPLRFYDRHQLQESVWVRVGDRTERLSNQNEKGQPVVWSLQWTSEVFSGVEKPGHVDLYLGYGQPPEDQMWHLGLFEVGQIVLQAPAEAEALSKVQLTWRLQPAEEGNSPTQWQLLRNDQEVVQTTAEQSWIDQPSGTGPWKYQVVAVDLDGRPYRSNIVIVTRPKVTPSSTNPFVQPAARELTVEEGQSLTFQVDLGNSQSGSHRFAWFLDGKRVSEGETWTYRPGFGAGGEKPKEVRAMTADGNNPSLVQRWSVRVLSVNRPPIITNFYPKGNIVEFITGKTLNFSVQASDPNKDERLTYVWSLDDQELTRGDIGRWQLPATLPEGTHKVTVQVQDRSGLGTQVTWNVVGKAPPTLPTWGDKPVEKTEDVTVGAASTPMPTPTLNKDKQNKDASGEATAVEMQSDPPEKKVAPKDDEALIAAAQEGDLTTVKKLLASGVDINAKDTKGNTALIVAADRGHSDTVKALLAQGAQVDARNQEGRTALSFSNPEVMKILIANGAVANMPIDNEGSTILMAIAREGDTYEDERFRESGFPGGITQFVEFLLAHGADVNQQDQNGMTALMWASVSSPTFTYRYNPSLTLFERETEGTASITNKLKIARILLRRGARIDFVNKEGKTALGIAESHGLPEMVRLLRQTGAR